MTFGAGAGVTPRAKPVGPIRVLVADDSITIRERIAEMLSQDPRFRVVGKAMDGQQCIEMLEAKRPDVVVLDLAMPRMDGVATTEWIMSHRPTPILICSASTNRTEVLKTYDALARGAVDILEKPIEQTGMHAFAETLRSAVELASRIRVVKHVHRGPLAPSLVTPVPSPPIRQRSDRPAPVARPWRGLSLNAGVTPRVLAIAASTGGPSALTTLLSGLGGAFPLPILVMLHLDGTFGAGFAEWLDGQVPQPATFAEDLAPLPAVGRPCVLVCPPGVHTVVEHGLLRVREGAPRNSCQPSGDVLFESLAREFGPSTIACILTGMGRDGAVGLRDLRRAGAVTFAQDAESSLIFGMPAAAIELGAASAILPLGDMAEAIREVAGAPRPEGARG